MATLATLYDRFFGGREAGGRVAELDVVEGMSALGRESSGPYALRALPNEDILFFVKRFDNSKAIPEANPCATSTAAKFFAGSLVTAALVVTLLLPSALGYRAGYRVEALYQERERLVKERAALELERARLLSPERLERLSESQQLVDPDPASVIYLQPAGQGVMASIGRPNSR